MALWSSHRDTAHTARLLPRCRTCRCRKGYMRPSGRSQRLAACRWHCTRHGTFRSWRCHTLESRPPRSAVHAAACRPIAQPHCTARLASACLGGISAAVRTHPERERDAWHPAADPLPTLARAASLLPASLDGSRGCGALASDTPARPPPTRHRRRSQDPSTAGRSIVKIEGKS